MRFPLCLESRDTVPRAGMRISLRQACGAFAENTMTPAFRIALACCTFAAVTAVATDARAQTLDKIKEAKSIAIGYRESSIPFSYLDGEQKPIGISMDLCRVIVDRIKQKLSMPSLAVQYQPVNSSNQIPLIANGTIDIECGGTANNAERQRVVAFSVATFVSQPRWLVKTSSGLKSALDLKGKPVVVTQGSNALGFAIRISKENNLDLNIQQAKDHAESMMMLDTGRAAAFLEDDILLAGERASMRSPDAFTFLPEGYETIYYGLMFRKDDPAFKAIVDDTLAGLMKGGEFTALYRKWFESPIPPRGVNLQFPMTELLKARVTNPSDKLG